MGIVGQQRKVNANGHMDDKGNGNFIGFDIVLELFMAMVWEVRTKRELLAVVLVNVLTNPIVVC